MSLLKKDRAIVSVIIKYKHQKNADFCSKIHPVINAHHRDKGHVVGGKRTGIADYVRIDRIDLICITYKLNDLAQLVHINGLV